MLKPTGSSNVAFLIVFQAISDLFVTRTPKKNGERPKFVLKEPKELSFICQDTLRKYEI